MANSQVLKVIVRDTEKTLFDGEVDRISSFNEVGPFDLFPMHANFISIIKKELTLFHNKEKVKELQIEQAVMKVKSDVVHILLGIETFLLEDLETTAPTPPPPAKK